MQITPLVPEGYEGELWKFRCRRCEEFFFVTKEYALTQERISYCHFCCELLDDDEVLAAGRQVLKEYEYHQKQIERLQKMVSTLRTILKPEKGQERGNNP